MSAPEPYVFAELTGHGLSWQEYDTEPDYDYDPEDKENYILIEEGQEVNSYSDWEAWVVDYVVIKRISDKKYFKMTVHSDSWSSLDYNCTGEYGGIVEVEPVLKTVYLSVDKTKRIV